MLIMLLLSRVRWCSHIIQSGLCWCVVGPGLLFPPPPPAPKLDSDRSQVGLWTYQDYYLGPTHWPTTITFLHPPDHLHWPNEWMDHENIFCRWTSPEFIAHVRVLWFGSCCLCWYNLMDYRVLHPNILPNEPWLLLLYKDRREIITVLIVSLKVLQ